jgi:hypothetical protein
VCWKGKETNYQEIYDYIDNNPDEEKLKEFEAKLADTSLLDYNVYICRFKKQMTFAQIMKELKIEAPARIAESQSAIYLAFQIFFS